MSDNIVGYRTLKEESSNIVIAIETSLQNGELLKAKRIRDILKVSENLVTFATQIGNHKLLWNNLTALQTRLRKVADNSTSFGVKNTCLKLVYNIWVNSKVQKSTEEDRHTDDEDKKINREKATVMIPNKKYKNTRIKTSKFRLY